LRRLPNRSYYIAFTTIVVLFTAVFFYLLANGLMNRVEPDDLTTNEFVNAVTQDRVTEVTYSFSDTKVTGFYLREGEKDRDKAVPFVSRYIGSDSLNELMAAHPDIIYKLDIRNNSLLIQFLPTLVLVVAFGALGWMMFNRIEASNRNQMQFGRSRAKKAHDERPTTKFADVAGIDEVVEELYEVKDFLSDPERYREFGAKIPRGVLLVGPPGTGKTLLARAVAGEAGVPFFSISGSDFVEMFVGVGASRVRDLFEQAKVAAPAIIFIDEIDAVGRQRGAGLGGGHDEREQTLNQLLVEMDGFTDHQSVILIAATNRPDILDPALLRPGRFDRQITVMRPDLKGREQILKVHSKDKPLAHSVDLETLARLTPGFTGADLANMMNEAALLTARRRKKLITMSELSEAMERAIAGPERKSRIMTEKEKRTIAYHEAGHALVGHVLEDADPIQKISIISRGQALGYTISMPEEDRFLASRKEMQAEMASLLGGRAAEELFCDDITTGASSDLERATTTARQMVTRYGMTEALGHQVFGQAAHEVFLGRDYSSGPDYSDETARRIDEEVSRIIKAAHESARSVLSGRPRQMELIVEVLMERETVDSEALSALLNDTWADYLAREPEILAAKAQALRIQEADDARSAAEAQMARELEQAERASMLDEGLDEPGDQSPTISDIVNGKVDLGELLRNLGDNPDTDGPPSGEAVVLPDSMLDEMPPPQGEPIATDTPGDDRLDGAEGNGDDTTN
jgi:cell division protease FtsH